MTGVRLHTRNLFLETHPFGDERLYLHGELRDVRHFDLPQYLGVEHPAGVVHHMGVDVEIDRELVIRECDAWMTTFPFEPSEVTRGETCPSVLAAYRSLVGVQLDRDYALRVADAVGGRRGCFHLLSLAQCIPAAVFAASARACRAALARPRGSRAAVLDGCCSWRAGSPLWAEARESAGSGFADFRRQIRVTAYAAEGPRLGMAASLADERADEPAIGAELELGLALPKLVVASAAARLTGAPFRGCTAVLPQARALEGLPISRGFTAAALARVGGGTGCAHLGALVIALTPVTAQASGALAGYLKLGVDERLRERGTNPQVDSCHMWRAGGPLAALASGGGRGVEDG